MRLPKRMIQGSPAHHRAPRQERETATRIGGRAVPQSGAGLEKGDARKPRFVRVECKTTSHKSYSIKTAIIDKMEAASLGAGEVPVFVIEFLGPPRRSVCVVPDYVLEFLAGEQQ